MIVEIRLKVNTEREKDPAETIVKILQNSYDYQQNNLDFDLQKFSDKQNVFTFTFYFNECDQPARTRETMREIQDLILEYL